MSNPAYVTQENVKFNGTLENAVVIGVNGSVRSIVLWDSLSTADRAILDAAITAAGSAHATEAYLLATKYASTNLYELFVVLHVGTKPHVPPFTPHKLPYVYFNGTKWAYLDDDTLVNS